MSKLKRNLIIFITSFCLLFTTACTVHQQELFFVKLGNPVAQTQTLEQAKAEFNPKTPTPAQHAVMVEFARKEAEREQLARFYAWVVEQDRIKAASSHDCNSAIDKHWPGDKAKAKSIVWRESRNIPSAANPSSSARGCFQMLAMHNHRYTAVGCSPSQWSNPDCATKAAAHLYREAGWSPWRLTY